MKIVTTIIILAVAVIVDRVVRGAVAILQVFGWGADWLISVSALGGAAIGFASTQTLGNFLAGIYLMVSRPFMVNDYVRIGDVEGEVREITVNYTKIYTPTFNILQHHRAS